MDYETENDALVRKVNDLEDEVRKTGSELCDYIFECSELKNRVDDVEFELEEATKALESAKKHSSSAPR